MVPLAAIESIELVDKKRGLWAWRRAHGVSKIDTGVISVLDNPNVALRLRQDTGLTWTRLQVTRSVPRWLLVYVDDPAAMIAAVELSRSRVELAPASE